MYLGLARGHFLNPTGGCKPFDKSADGYCRAEGCVLFILKRLSDAIAENDRIHGVIRDVVVNQSGNSHSITHPHSETQIDLFQQLLKKTNVDPASISVIEAHGTGTQVCIPSPDSWHESLTDVLFLAGGRCTRNRKHKNRFWSISLGGKPASDQFYQR